VHRRLCALATLVAAFYAREASADVTSWFYAGAGLMSLNEVPKTVRPFTLQIETGVGSPPHGPVTVGGVFKTMTFFGQGTDLALVTRVATGGFVRGGFGVAVDAGAYQRWWGPDNSTGFLGSLVVGVPFGLQLSATTEQGSSNVHAYGATLGIDFLRLTVYRTALSSFWPNPFPPANADGSR
jgi:hypothetical protein